MPGPNPPTTYFGLWSKQKITQVTALLDTLSVRYEVIEEAGLDQHRLEMWHAWDPTADDPHLGFHLDIWFVDFPKVGLKIVEAFPERKFKD